MLVLGVDEESNSVESLMVSYSHFSGGHEEGSHYACLGLASRHFWNNTLQKVWKLLCPEVENTASSISEILELLTSRKCLILCLGKNFYVDLPCILVKLSMHCKNTMLCFIKAQWHTSSSIYIAAETAKPFPFLPDQRQLGQNRQAFQPILWELFSFYQPPHGF